MSVQRPRAITKELSRNDTGETGGHQAGMLIPRDPALLAFFPPLDGTAYNPRHKIVFHDVLGTKWTFSFIYYNNSLFGGTRNEYRVTCMTPFMRAHNLHAGDKLTLTRDQENRYHITCIRLDEPPPQEERLKLGSGWKIVSIA